MQCIGKLESCPSEFALLILSLLQVVLAKTPQKGQNKPSDGGSSL
jgi:hypothetical protein